MVLQTQINARERAELGRGQKGDKEQDRDGPAQVPIPLRDMSIVYCRYILMKKMT